MPGINTAWTPAEVVTLKREAPKEHMRGYKETPAGTRAQSDPAAALFAEGGWGVIRFPRRLFLAKYEPEAQLAAAIVRSVERLEPATTPLRKAVYRILARLADDRVQCEASALVLGMLLASAKLHGDKIQTHPRDLAKEVGVRYAVLLKITRIAKEELGKI